MWWKFSCVISCRYHLKMSAFQLTGSGREFAELRETESFLAIHPYLGTLHKHYDGMLDMLQKAFVDTSNHSLIAAEQLPFRLVVNVSSFSLATLHFSPDVRFATAMLYQKKYCCNSDWRFKNMKWENYLVKTTSLERLPGLFQNWGRGCFVHARLWFPVVAAIPAH